MKPTKCKVIDRNGTIYVIVSDSDLDNESPYPAPWPEYDEHEYYDNETSHLMSLVYACDLEWCGWADIARRLNADHGNNRTPSAVRQKFERMEAAETRKAQNQKEQVS